MKKLIDKLPWWGALATGLSLLGAGIALTALLGFGIGWMPLFGMGLLLTITGTKRGLTTPSAEPSERAKLSGTSTLAIGLAAASLGTLLCLVRGLSLSALPALGWGTYFIVRGFIQLRKEHSTTLLTTTVEG
jgi:hypothetical protein